MVVEYFRPVYNYTNGIIKANFVNNETSNIVVTSTSINPNYPHIYLSAILENKYSYYQSLKADQYPIINITFDKYILVSHFALVAMNVDDKPWMFPKNWTLKGCIEDKCRLIANSSDPDYFNQLATKVTPVSPGVYQKFSFQAENTHREGIGTFYAIYRIEFFGYTCDFDSECNGNALLKTFCYKRNTFYFLKAATFIYVNILS